MIFKKTSRIRVYVKPLNKIKVFKMDCRKNTTNNIRHETRAIKNKTDKNRKRTWNNILFRV